MKLVIGHIMGLLLSKAQIVEAKLSSKTLSLPAGVQIIWSKVDSHSTQIAIGTVVVAPEYMERATVTEDARGSTLHIGIAKVCFIGYSEYLSKIFSSLVTLANTSAQWLSGASSPHSIMKSESEVRNVMQMPLLPTTYFY